MAPDASAPLPVVFQTARLRAERIGPRHEDAFLAFYRDERVIRWLLSAGETMPTDDETRDWLRRKIAEWEQTGVGVYAVFEHGGSRLAGRAGLMRGHLEGHEDGTELLYAFAHDTWGRGYATEIGRKLVDLAFSRLALDSLIAYTRPDNERSRHVMEKLGFVYEGDVTHDGLGHVLYRLRRSDAVG